MIAWSSSSVQRSFLISGFRWLCQRSRHCLPILPGKFLAIKLQFLGPCSKTNFITRSSSYLVCINGVLPRAPWWAWDWAPSASDAGTARQSCPRKTQQFFSNFERRTLPRAALTSRPPRASTTVFSRPSGRSPAGCSRSARSFLSSDRRDSCFRWKNPRRRRSPRHSCGSRRWRSCGSRRRRSWDFWRWRRGFSSRWGARSWACGSRAKARYWRWVPAAPPRWGSGSRVGKVRMIL